MNLLDGKVALITGAGSGIGKETARVFAQNKAKIVVNYRNNKEGALLLEKEIKKSGGEIVLCKGDISVLEDCKRMINCAVENFGKLDILVNNSGMGIPHDSLTDYTYEDFDKIVATNLKGTFQCSMEALRQMLKQKTGGSIVSLSSTTVQQSRGVHTIYTMTKAGIEALMRSMAQEFGKDNIRCNIVSPGPTETKMMHMIFTPERKKKTEDSIPMRRMATPNDIANAILYLSSDLAKYVTGQRITVDGGRTIY